MDAVLAWLEERRRVETRTEELRKTNPLSLPPASMFMSLFPHLVQQPDDLELNPAQLFGLASHGVYRVMEQVIYEGKHPQNKPMVQFTPKELDAAFGFTSILVPKPAAVVAAPPLLSASGETSGLKRTGSAAGMAAQPPMPKKPRPPLANTTTPSLPDMLLSPAPVPPPSAASAPLPATTTTTTTTTASDTSLPAPPPLPPLPPPRVKTPPPLPSSKPVVIKLPGIIKLPTGDKNGGGDDDDDSASSSSEHDLLFTAQEDEREANSGAPSVLKQELLKTVDALIRITNWPRPTRALVQSYKSKGYPEGNPFAVVLKRGCGFVPDHYFDVIDRPLDLTTVRDRVQGNFYLTLAMFETDISLVVSNALRFNTAQGFVKSMAEHLQLVANKELENCKHRLTRAAIQSN